MIKTLKQTPGFTLIELMVTISILFVIGLLGYIALKSSNETTELAQAKSEVDGELHHVMNELTSELELAKAPPPFTAIDKNPGIANISVSADKHSVTFQRPITQDTSTAWTWSNPVTFRWDNEDLGTPPNGKLDSGEDKNNDKILN